MKKIFLFAISIVGLLGPFGCGKLQMPTTPSAQANNVAAPTTPSASLGPVFSKAWSTAGTTNLVNPQCVATDGSGNVLVTDSYLDSVMKYDSNGDLLNQWGNRGDNSLDQPMGVAVWNNNVFVADAANARVIEYDANGNLITIISPLDGNGDPMFAYPTCLTFDKQGNLYVCDDQGIYQFNTNLQLTAHWGGEENPIYQYAMGAAADASGNIFVADYNSDVIVKFNTATSQVQNIGTSGNQNGQFDGPSDVKLDANGNLYVVDTDNSRVEVLSSTGAYISQFGFSTDPTQTLNGPTGLAMDGNGNVYVVDNGNRRIVKYSIN